MTAFVSALVATLLITPGVVIAARRWELLDVPNHRSSHSTPVPHGGGVAVGIAVVIGMVAAGDWSDEVAGLVAGAILLGSVGFVDDRVGLPAAPRLAAQLATPLVFALLVVDRSGSALLLVSLIAAVVVAGYVNAFNFMDGINGISGTQAAIAGGFLAVIADRADLGAMGSAGWAVCGASIAFLPFNVPRAVIFLGDVGSYFLGFWLAGLAMLLVADGESFVVVLGPFVLYLLDTATVLIRRARRGDPIMEAHREHAYQRLTQVGWSHSSVSALCAAVSGGCAAIMYSTVDASAAVQVSALAGCVAIVALYLAVPGAIEARRPVRAQML